MRPPDVSAYSHRCQGDLDDASPARRTAAPGVVHRRRSCRPRPGHRRRLPARDDPARKVPAARAERRRSGELDRVIAPVLVSPDRGRRQRVHPRRRGNACEEARIRSWEARRGDLVCRGWQIHGSHPSLLHLQLHRRWKRDRVHAERRRWPRSRSRDRTASGVALQPADLSMRAAAAAPPTFARHSTSTQ
jgi:hypothetical protein